MSKLGFKVLAFLLGSSLSSGVALAYKQQAPRHWSGVRRPLLNQIDVAGVKRSFYLYIPESAKMPAPAVFVFHGGGGNAQGVDASIGGMAALADAKGFVMVVPDGTDKHWNDGRAIEGQMQADDVGFVSAIIDGLVGQKQADPARIYACGISNGGFFSQYVAQQLRGRIAAVASVAASVSEDFARSEISCEPTMFVLGTKDPLIPINGGRVGGRLIKGDRGLVLPFDVSINLRRKANGAGALTSDEKLPDFVRRDHCQAEVMRYGKPGDASEVLVYKIDGGGHTWPQGMQYLPVALVGPVCRDFNCNEAIWNFFSLHHL
ncbi:MAG: dienelactone hydrolase family protein [Cyanobacteria bacterium SZAS LIN-3]|nr:dienelactone hydrolase family protein [Cyanobacteria bacterium SZAS LIN-3]